MSCSTPVIASNVSSIPEVVGDGALLINPFDADDLKDSMARMLTDESLRSEIAQKGYERSKEFTWDKTCLNTLKVYEEAYGARASEK
jgi:glycosyltransferase involved in cell wall biosynthesis